MPRQLSHLLPPVIDVMFPKSLSHLGGPFVAGQAELNSLRGDRGVGSLIFVEQQLAWLDCFNYFVFQVLPDGSKKAIRKATDEDIRSYRVPIWIQGEEIPMCCGREMIFIGQIDDNSICTEQPTDAKVWWHDTASFYVFSCPQCLECAAVGQQF